jgi:Tol biopolymer transport system component
MKTFTTIFFLVVLLNSCFAQPYLGQTPPGSIPQKFAPGIISLNNRLETYPTFSPDGKDMYFSVVNASWLNGVIFHTQERNGVWTIPDTADFSKNIYINWESFISPDGNKQFFASDRPPSLSKDIWMMNRTSDTTWSTPVRLNSPINSSAEDGSACVTNNGTLYFKSARGGGINGSMLYKSLLIDSTYSQIENLGNIIHTVAGESEPFMSPDESYLIFTSPSRPGGHGGYDLWICFRKTDGTWTEPVNMGPDINTANHEYGPRVTQDGQYLFFTRDNGSTSMDIYWVSANIIDSLRSVTVSINNQSENMASDYKLFQNYPNPFNPSTVISYSLPGNSFVSLKIYNILGKEIASLVNSVQRRGSHDITFNTNNMNLSSGVYLYTLIATEINTNKVFKESKVMNFIK